MCVWCLSFGRSTMWNIEMNSVAWFSFEDDKRTKQRCCSFVFHSGSYFISLITGLLVFSLYVYFLFGRWHAQVHTQVCKASFSHPWWIVWEEPLANSCMCTLCMFPVPFFYFCFMAVGVLFHVWCEPTVFFLFFYKCNLAVSLIKFGSLDTPWLLLLINCCFCYKLFTLLLANAICSPFVSSTLSRGEPKDRLDETMEACWHT